MAVWKRFKSWWSRRSQVQLDVTGAATCYPQRFGAYGITVGDGNRDGGRAAR
ncbi:hypothetical protein [Micromonospora sp. NPDC005174]|uniref:hypothetical protein n=1 Tax=unclassified Micromonospora TaxID=2617518 RepID=UPI0033A978BA